ncbi:MAG TPA: isoprenylcysteine carboxylmethyltransferase family protein [Gaiellales bacterium]|nr:isoprenylcysteine carboxylmethyltransferase family protein [Gaiellales bacterium]
MTHLAATPITRVSDLFTLVGSRLIPTLLFTTMATVSVLAVGAAPSASAAAFHLLSATLWGLFIVLINIRPAPLRRNRSAVGVVVALISQLAVIAVGLFGARTDGGVAVIASDVLLIAGLVFAICSVAVLGRCFGILPDVRGLVTRGPYRLVRHPLYLGELTAVLGIVLGSRRPLLAGGTWLVCVGLQLARTTYEERNIRAEFPQYDEYAARTKRLIPGVL